MPILKQCMLSVLPLKYFFEWKTLWSLLEILPSGNFTVISRDILFSWLHDLPIKNMAYFVKLNSSNSPVVFCSSRGRFDAGLTNSHTPQKGAPKRTHQVQNQVVLAAMRYNIYIYTYIICIYIYNMYHVYNIQYVYIDIYIRVCIYIYICMGKWFAIPHDKQFVVIHTALRGSCHILSERFHDLPCFVFSGPDKSWIWKNMLKLRYVLLLGKD